MSEPHSVPVKTNANPVYRKLRNLVLDTSRELRADYNLGEQSDEYKNLMKRNHGVRCFMKRGDIFHDEDSLNKSIAHFKTNAPTRLEVSHDTELETTLRDPRLSDTTLMALYSPDSCPRNVIFGGIPSAQTDLAIRSNFLWQLGSPTLRLADTDEYCELYAQTSFYFPGVEIRRDNYLQNYAVKPLPVSTNVMLMSDVNAVAEFLSDRDDSASGVKVANLIACRLTFPFLMALRQNENRVKLGMEPIRNLVIGDLGMNNHERGINTLYVQRLNRCLEQFAGCFDRVTVCGSQNLLMHVHCSTLIN